ncbi:asparaginase [Sporosarcina beigongshangi]|uniref:asparaginase n=1 Tax=Sporosarcina beigongshangi TaxID=2782538 RepID=UPI00193A9213|nr:asparaginase [Sporosarcina beigongshangi]
MSSEVLVNVERGDLVESIHRGHIVIVNSKGEVVASKGDINKVVYARSSMKPLQAIPIVETGAMDHYDFDEWDLSLTCASHNGEDQHTDRVTSILQRLDLGASDLQCGMHSPRWPEAYENLIKSGKKLTPVYNNCSGKHSGMLATAKHMHETLEDYYKLDHPVQQRILSVISEMTETSRDDIAIGIDGCGVPVHGVPLKNLAVGFAKLADPSELSEARQQAIQKITSAMMKTPEMVGGTERFCTDFMKVMQGKMFGKSGAEGVYCIGVPEMGIGIALKIEDGNGRATSSVAIETLSQLNLINEEEKKQLEIHHLPKLLNARKEIIGLLRPVFSINR